MRGQGVGKCQVGVCNCSSSHQSRGQLIHLAQASMQDDAPNAIMWVCPMCIILAAGASTSTQL